MKNLRVRAAFAALLCLVPLAGMAQTEVHQLPQSVVTVHRFTDIGASTPAGVTVITADEIRASGAATVNEALMRLLGVVGRQDLYGGGEYAIDLRGFGATADNNQVIVVDGQRLSEADTGGTRLAGIPIETVVRIEVLHGSAAVLYGEGASAGVIAITTRAGLGVQRRDGGSAYASVGGFGTREWRANGTLVSGGLSLDVAGQQRRSDGHRDNFASRSGATSFGAQWGGESLRVGLRLAQDSLDTGLPGALSAAQFAANPAQATTPNDSAAIDSQRASVFAEAFVGAWRVALDLGRRDKSLRSLNSGFAFDYEVDANNAALRARHDASLEGLFGGAFGSAKNSLSLGLDRSSWRREVLGAFGNVAHQRSHAVFAKDDVTFAGGARLSLGLRSEQLSKDHSGTASSIDKRMSAWEIGASHPLGQAWTGYGRLAKSFRLANVDEFSFTSPGADLQPQTSRDIEFGLRWGAAGSRFEARLYRSNLNNEIGFDPTAAGPFGPGANVNFDPTRRQGFELEGSHALGRDLSLRANLALRQSRFVSGANAGRDVPLAPSRSLSLRALWSPATGHQLSGGVNWVGRQHPDYANQCTIPSYATADLRYAYAVKAFEFSAGVANLFDRKYFTQAFQCAAGVTQAIYPEPGRAFNLALRWNF